MNDDTRDIVQHTRNFIWMRLETAVASTHQGVKNEARIILRHWLNGARTNTSCIRGSRLTNLGELDIIKSDTAG